MLYRTIDRGCIATLLSRASRRRLLYLLKSAGSLKGLVEKAGLRVPRATRRISDDDPNIILNVL